MARPVCVAKRRDHRHLVAGPVDVRPSRGSAPARHAVPSKTPPPLVTSKEEPVPRTANPQPVHARPTSPALADLLPTNDLGEFPIATPWCQRWRERRHSFRHTSAGGFDPRHYIVEALPETAAKEFVVGHHYSGSFPSARFRFGLYDVGDGGARLCGVAVFGVPVTAAVLTRPLPDLQPYVESLECSRFVLLDEVPANAESWFLARCFDELLVLGVRGIVSFADPVPRRDASGNLVAVGHVGTIYQATNAIYMGRATPRTVKLLPNGVVLNSGVRAGSRRTTDSHEAASQQVDHRLGPAVARP